MVNIEHHVLYDKALIAIRAVFNDTSVSKEETRISLKELINEINIFLDALENRTGAAR